VCMYTNEERWEMGSGGERGAKENADTSASPVPERTQPAKDAGDSGWALFGIRAVETRATAANDIYPLALLSVQEDQKRDARMPGTR